MTVLSVLLTILWIVIIPAFTGAGIVFFPVKNGMFPGASEDAKSGKGEFGKAGFGTDGFRTGGFEKTGLFIAGWFIGQLLLWCTFQPVAVTAILKKRTFGSVVKEYSVVTAVLVLISLTLIIVRVILMHREKTENIRFTVQNQNENHGESVKTGKRRAEDISFDAILINIFRIVFWVLLIIEIVLQAVLAYMEVDDSFYVSEAVEAGSSGYMYFKIPYTGYTTELDIRHSLEPFPIWLAYIARVTGMNTTVLAHVLLPMLLLPLTYGVYALIGKRMLGRNGRYLPVFMVFTEILVLFGYYSTRTPEKFFITRIRQGKSALASLIIPGIILCLFVILEYIKENRTVDFRLWLMLFCLNMSGCLCSTLGAVLCMMPVLVTAFLITVMYKKWKHLPGMIISCLPNVFFTLLYLIL